MNRQITPSKPIKSPFLFSAKKKVLSLLLLKRSRFIHCCFFGFSLFTPLFLSAQQSPSDQYCAHLHFLQSQALLDKQDLGPVASIINFVNDLTQKITLETLEKEAFEKKMTFEAFQKWANETHSLKVNNHYKAKYLATYLKKVCGEITYSATFGATPHAEQSSSAEKQFDPKGHPYAEEVSSPTAPSLKDDSSSNR